MSGNSFKGEILEKLIYKWSKARLITFVKQDAIAIMTEDIEKLFLDVMIQINSNKTAERVMQHLEGENNEKDSK